MQVSVVIQTKNQHQHLRRCLESLKNQSDKDFEVIVVDQSKNRKVKPIIKPYNLKYYRIKNRTNPAFARNFGINVSFGDIIAFLDPEVTPNTEWIGVIKHNFKTKHPAVLAGKIIDKSDVKNPITTFQNAIVSKYSEEELVRNESDKILSDDKGWFSVASSKNSAFLKSEILKVGGIDERMSETHDIYDLCLRIIRNQGKVVYDSELVVIEEHMQKHNRVSNWRRYAHNLAYFSIKNSSGNFIYRIFKTFWKLFSRRGPYALSVKALLAKDTFVLKLPFLWISVNIGTIQGLYIAIYRKRKLRNFATALTKDYLIFTKR